MRPLDPEAVREAREMAERGLYGFDTLDVGPRDYNVFNVCDRLRTAAALLEEAQRVSEVASSYAHPNTGGERG